jgi:hypothetical protein
MRTGLKRIFVVACVAVGTVAASSSPAAGAAVVGQTGTPSNTCPSTAEWLVPPGNLGNSYVVPLIPPAGALSITSWSHQANANAGQRLKLKVFRPVAGVDYTVVGQDGFRDVTPDALNTFTTNIPVKPGDVVGFTTVIGSGPIGCGLQPSGQTYYFSNGDYPDGAQATFVVANGQRLNVSAVVEPTNTFSLGQTTRNKKRGTATLTVNVPNPGELTVSGKGAREASATGATTAKSVPAGRVNLTIKAKGKKRKKLIRNGKVKLKPTITYTPTAGSPNTQSTKLKLKKR